MQEDIHLHLVLHAVSHVRVAVVARVAAVPHAGPEFPDQHREASTCAAVLVAVPLHRTNNMDDMLMLAAHQAYALWMSSSHAAQGREPSRVRQA